MNFNTFLQNKSTNISFNKTRATTFCIFKQTLKITGNSLLIDKYEKY